MGFATAVSLLLIAAGAILVWAVTGTVTGIDITAVGVILIVVGIVGLIFSLLAMASWMPWGRSTTTRHYDGPRDEVVRDV